MTQFYLKLGAIRHIFLTVSWGIGPTIYLWTKSNSFFRKHKAQSFDFLLGCSSKVSKRVTHWKVSSASFPCRLGFQWKTTAQLVWTYLQMNPATGTLWITFAVCGLIFTPQSSRASVFQLSNFELSWTQYPGSTHCLVFGLISVYAPGWPEHLVPY